MIIYIIARGRSMSARRARSTEMGVGHRRRTALEGDIRSFWDRVSETACRFPRTPELIE